MNNKFEIYFVQSDQNKVEMLTVYKTMENYLKNDELVGSIYETTIVNEKNGAVEIMDGFKVVICYDELSIERKDKLVATIKRGFNAKKVYTREIVQSS